jgi:hypothetical protein
VTNEGFILYGNPFAQEAVALNLALLANGAPLLDFHERANLGVVSDPATIEINEILKRNVLSENDIGCDFTIHRVNILKTAQFLLAAFPFEPKRIHFTRATLLALTAPPVRLGF